MGVDHCVIVSHSAGGLIAAAAMTIAGNSQRSWATSTIATLPEHIKAHVAYAPAFAGSALATAAVALAYSTTVVNCLTIYPVFDAIFDISNSVGGKSNSVKSCQNLRDYAKHGALVDLVPIVSAAVWRPILLKTSPVAARNVPTLVVAAAHPTATSAVHWFAPIAAGFDDGVLTVDSQLGRYPLPSYVVPINIKLGTNIASLFDRGAPAAKAVPNFLDLRREIGRRPLASYAGSANYGLLPTGMLLKNVTRGGVPAQSSGLPNVYSFLQSASSHMFPVNLGKNPKSCGTSVGPWGTGPILSWDYQDADSVFGQTQSVEELRATYAVNELYNPSFRSHFQNETLTFPIPLVSSALKSDIEYERRGKYVKVRYFKKNRLWWIWTRDYFRISGWSCLDQIDMVHKYALRP